MIPLFVGHSLLLLLSYLGGVPAEIKYLLLKANVCGIFVHVSRFVKFMLHTKNQGSKPPGFSQEDFFIFSLYKPM